MITLYDWAVINEPEILEEWDYEKNKDIDIKKIASHSSQKVFWKCPQYKYSYSARIGKEYKDTNVFTAQTV